MNSQPKVLLVEDNAQNAYLVRFLLERAGMQVVHTRSGQQALSMAAAEMPAAILLDIQLPDMDGYEVATKLIADPKLREIPIVAVTSFAMPHERQKALALGCRGYIEKPISPARFVDQVRSFLAPA